MKSTIRKKVLVIITICMFVCMMGLSVSTSIEGTNFSLSGLTALASGNTYSNMELADHTCWKTGRTFLRCRHGSYVCNASDQGTC